jgi:hypothetical protein
MARLGVAFLTFFGWCVILSAAGLSKVFTTPFAGSA